MRSVPMATIRPFVALRPPRERAAEVSAVPYDVVSTAEARELAAGNPWSFLHVSRPEISLPAEADPYSETVYRTGAASFETLKRDCPLVTEESPSLYVYRLRMASHEQSGIACCCSIDEYDADEIRKHERTREDKENDRTRHMLALRAQTGPVFLTYRDRTGIDRIVAGVQREEPLYDFTAPDGIGHTVWRIGGETADRLVGEFRDVPLLYIADGHHRAASASRAREQLRAANPAHSGSEDYNFFLTVLFPAGQVRILPYNRIVKELGGRSAEQFLAALGKTLPVTEGATPDPARRGEVRLYLGGRWYGLSLEPPRERGMAAAGPAGSLDVSLLQELVLEPVLGIHDVRTDKRIDFVGGIRGTGELERLVDSGAAAAAFSMYPLSLEDLMAISDAKEIMPPKSTWFEPKLRDGLLIHPI
jgi:uncharacterized protein (DUF1015 family)